MEDELGGALATVERQAQVELGPSHLEVVVGGAGAADEPTVRDAETQGHRDLAQGAHRRGGAPHRDEVDAGPDADGEPGEVEVEHGEVEPGVDLGGAAGGGENRCAGLVLARADGADDEGGEGSGDVAGIDATEEGMDLQAGPDRLTLAGGQGVGPGDVAGPPDECGAPPVLRARDGEEVIGHRRQGGAREGVEESQRVTGETVGQGGDRHVRRPRRADRDDGRDHLGGGGGTQCSGGSGPVRDEDDGRGPGGEDRGQGVGLALDAVPVGACGGGGDGIGEPDRPGAGGRLREGGR